MKRVLMVFLVGVFLALMASFATAQLASGNGLYAEYRNLGGSVVILTVDGEGPISHGWNRQCGCIYQNVCGSWAGIWNGWSRGEETLTGYLEAPVTGTYALHGWIDDYLDLFLEGVLIAHVDTMHTGHSFWVDVDLVAGEFYEIKLEFKNRWGSTNLNLYWTLPDEPYEIIPKAYLYTEIPIPIIEKEITSGPDLDANGEIDVVVEVGQSETTFYDFTIRQSGLGGLLIVDTVPAEWKVNDAVSDNEDDEVDFFPAGRGNPSKSATKIEWRPASASSSLLVSVETRQSPGKKNTKFAPTSCGALYLNEDGAAAYEVDENGEPLRDPDTGEKLPPIMASNPLCLAAVGDINGDGVIVRDGSGDEDGDGLSDLDEVMVTGTDPCNPDTDGDGVTDDVDPDPLDPLVF